MRDSILVKGARLHNSITGLSPSIGVDQRYLSKGLPRESYYRVL
jgi:hypothetical protein